MGTKTWATLWAIAAAATYALSTPLSKLLLDRVGPVMLTALLYLGAGLAMVAYSGARRGITGAAILAPLTCVELPYTVAMVMLDILAPVLMMFGIRMSRASNVSLLGNFEIVATSLVALMFFHEQISRRLWCAIALVTLASAILGFEGVGSLSFNWGSLLVLGACICWGFENNCTRKISSKSPVQIVMVKGLGSGIGALAIALFVGERFPDLPTMGLALLLGSVAYGFSIGAYVRAQRDLGAAKTGAYYSVAPFLGVLLSMWLLGERPEVQFYVAAAIMMLATVLIAKDTIEVQHTHEHGHIHRHKHRHGDFVHTHKHIHVHSHLHAHGPDLCDHSHDHADVELVDHDHVHPVL